MYLQLKAFILNSKIKKEVYEMLFQGSTDSCLQLLPLHKNQQMNRQSYPNFYLIVKINQNKNKGCHPVFTTQAGWMAI